MEEKVWGWSPTYNFVVLQPLVIYKEKKVNKKQDLSDIFSMFDAKSTIIIVLTVQWY